MPLVFPTSPNLNDTYLGWYWNGSAWKLSAADARAFLGHFSFTSDPAATQVDLTTPNTWAAINPAPDSTEDVRPTSMGALGPWIDGSYSGFSLAGLSDGAFINLSVGVLFDYDAVGSIGEIRFKVHANLASSNAVFYLNPSSSSGHQGTVGEEIATIAATLPIKAFMIGDTVASAGWISIEVASSGPAKARIANGEYQIFN